MWIQGFGSVSILLLCWLFLVSVCAWDAMACMAGEGFEVCRAAFLSFPTLMLKAPLPQTLTPKP